MSLVKRIMAVMIAIGLAVPSVGVVASGENKADEEVTLIVQMQDGAVFESSAALASGGVYAVCCGGGCCCGGMYCCCCSGCA